MIGLKRYTVKLESYTKEWKRAFQKSKKKIHKMLKNKDIQVEHIGSTSIEGILSKPIIDIGIGTTSKKEIKEIVQILSENGYTDNGDRGKRGGYLMAKYVEPEVISHHIHILELDDQQWKNYLDFRDSLSTNKQLSEAYENLKKELAKKYKADRAKYTDGKNEFIQSVLKRIQQKTETMP